MKLSIIIPIYNEQDTVADVLGRIGAVRFPIEYEIILVDDASRDTTYEAALSAQKALGTAAPAAQVRIFRNPVNRGKGYSIRKGISESSGDIIIVQDADTEYDPGEIPRVIWPIIDGAEKVVYGSRFLGVKRPDGMALPNFVANKALTFLTNLLFGLRITDMETCYKAYRADIIKKMELKANRFTFEPEVTAQAAKLGVRIKEVPISYSGRSAEQGKKIKSKDFFYAIGTLLCQRMTP
ncbi:MAG: glycosyltransferase family 2 protein [Candidatus Omnitrophota bacterium]